MRYRDLTKNYVCMRDNEMDKRRFFSKNNTDIESLLTSTAEEDAFPQECQNTINSIKFEFQLIKQKTSELIRFHNRSLVNTTLSDQNDQNEEIQLQSKELNELISLTHKQLSKLSIFKEQNFFRNYPIRKKLLENIILSFARKLQDLSSEFQSSQSKYLDNLKSRDERINSYVKFDIQEQREKPSNSVNNFFLEKKLDLTQNSEEVKKREEQIHAIYNSILELNSVFRSVAQIISDQSEMVERIDYNVDVVSQRVESGLKHLSKASEYQKGDKKMKAIIVLFLLVVISGVTLIFTKFR